jgi:type I restriction enzyme, S subunit
MSLWSVPNSWKWSTIEDIAAKQANAVVDGPFGSNLKVSDYVSEGVPVLQGKNITNDSFEWKDIRYISERKSRELSRSSVRVGDFLVVKIGSIGYSARVDNLKGHPYAIIPANLAKVTTDRHKVHPNFLSQWLRHPRSKNYLIGAASKTAQPALSLGKIKSLPIPLPPLPEQERIAAILDQVDEVRQRQRTSIARAAKLASAIFLEMFGDPMRNSRKWPRDQLRHLGKILTGGTPPSNRDGMFDGPVPFVTPGDLGSNQAARRSVTEAGAAESKVVRAGATLVCCIGATIGKMGVISQKSAFNQQINGIEWDHPINDRYGFHAMSFLRGRIAALGASTTLPILKKSSFEKLEIPVPPFDLQETFCARVSQWDPLLVLYRRRLEKLDILFASLQHRAFRGELTAKAVEGELAKVG